MTEQKIGAAFLGGCRRFDGAINGLGGCPMAKNELVGNIATEKIIAFMESRGESLNIDHQALDEAIRIAGEIFPKH